MPRYGGYEDLKGQEPNEFAQAHTKETEYRSEKREHLVGTAEHAKWIKSVKSDEAYAKDRSTSLIKDGYQKVEFDCEDPSPSPYGMSRDIENYMMESANIVNKRNADWYNKFARRSVVDPYNANTTTKEYIFITKPDLHLFKGEAPNPELTENSPFFADAIERYPDVARQLMYSRDFSCPFSPLLSNAINGSVSLPGINAGSIETASNIYGTHLTYRGTSYDSDEQHDFDIEFKDTKYLEVYMFFKMYDMYERMKWKGLVSPTSFLYTYRKILHDQMSLYKFVVGEDGMTLRYWAKMTGIYPTNVPRDAFSELADGEITYSINFKANWVEDMDPKILIDFNNTMKQYASNNATFQKSVLSKKYKDRLAGYKTIDLFDQRMQSANPKWALCPMIYIDKSDSNIKTNRSPDKYYLRWLA